ncbi:hypothetical protein C8R44DRAFT_327039 [Mycena epipterygia]|nr:hypothetical protein C8R44DRAFT_327039 [Mycena epipterygia]
MDKSQFQGQLFEHILKTLVSKLENNEISADTVANIIETTGWLASKSGTMEARLWSGNLYYYSNRLDIIYQFCSSLPQLDGWITIVLAAGLLTQYHEAQWYHHNSSNGDPGWVYKALNNVDVSTEGHDQWDDLMVAGVSGLLRALNYYDVPLLKEHLPILLQALSVPGDIFQNAAHLLVKENIVDWFQDHELQPILQASSVWPSLARVPIDINSHSFTKNFIHLGYTLANIPDWHPHIHKELCSWITAFFKYEPWDLAEKYNSVLSTIWNPDTGDYEFANNIEKALGLSFVALSNSWESFNFGMSDSLQESVKWLHCTSSMVMRTRYYYREYPWLLATEMTPHFKTIFSVPLRNSLINAATAAKEIVENSLKEVSHTRRAIFHTISKILEEMADKMPQSTDPKKDDEYWWGQRYQFKEDIKQLEKSICDMPE